eukprot:CAMPEP_0176456764 /NCGR_PEP_ID=MMETSP0127-20121128/31489_1 /TAXON_ID=938130 /ORGANISM="Platyophrya macrostoma, Strain WH" /LENGTH=379 /DNA_ID=CAMNT_0017846799 /DNA_START=81 /DNA_END=1216 /DNA_ORIENTATION=+
MSAVDGGYQLRQFLNSSRAAATTPAPHLEGFLSLLGARTTTSTPSSHAPPSSSPNVVITSDHHRYTFDNAEERRKGSPRPGVVSILQSADPKPSPVAHHHDSVYEAMRSRLSQRNRQLTTRSKAVQGGRDETSRDINNEVMETDDTTQWSKTSLAAPPSPYKTTQRPEWSDTPSSSTPSLGMPKAWAHAMALSEVRRLERENLCLEEHADRQRISDAAGHQMELWSVQMRLQAKLKLRNKALRPSQVFLESLRIKDAAEIDLLRRQIAVLSRHQVPTTGACSSRSHSLISNHPIPNDDDRAMTEKSDELPTPPTSDERREWNELYRNMQAAAGKAAPFNHREKRDHRQSPTRRAAATQPAQNLVDLLISMNSESEALAL